MAASPTATAVSRPVPLRSPESATVDLHHPTPDLQSLQGAYISNIERLEDHAERMSESGSDLGEEIRKLQLEQKISDSRRSSLLSGAPIEDAPRPFDTRSRNASTSSYTNSIVDVNVAARWGGYSPGGYVTSPVGSLRSGSFPHQTPQQRQRSGSRTSRLGQVVHTEEQEEDMEGPFEHPASPQSYRSAPRPARRNSSPHRSVSSFTQKYDQIAQEIQNEFHQQSPTRDFYSHTRDVPQEQPHHDPNFLNPHEMPDRPSTAASTDTTRQARVLWHDFDGVHCPDIVEEEGTPSRGSDSRHSSLMRDPPELALGGAPPPEDGMVFYPAPVPKLLNLPKRLSQVPAANVQARRRKQLLESMKADNRKSAPWLLETGAGAESSKPSRMSMMDPRKSRQSLAHLPPQLRASAYFDQVAAAQDFEVKGESAEATLDSILEASAHAPVSVFTDTFAGPVGDEVYGKEKHERKTSNPVYLDKADARKSRSSLNLLDAHTNSSGDRLNKLKKRNSSADLNMLTVRAGESRMSLGDELDEPDLEARGFYADGDVTPTGRLPDNEEDQHPDSGQEEEEQDEEAEEQYFGPPTTLLAELQMRKAQQKTRNLNAATAFTAGIHATLLELDAVAEVEKKKRQRQKVNLAWEAAPPGGEGGDDSDDDVPLGVLFPGHTGLVNKRAGARAQHTSDWDRPLGLIAQREVEESEPLSRRRTRLVGADPSRLRDLSPSKRHTQLPDIRQSQQYLTIPGSGTPQPESEEDEGETLAQRVRRLRDRKELDNALGADVRKSTVSGDFAAEMMSQFGVPEDDKARPTPSPGNGEEETLGQRRARLQAEALTRGDANPLASRPPLRASMSMANILSANPVDIHHQARKVSNEQLLNSLPQGSLLHQNAVDQSRKQADRIELNRRISSYGNLDQPLVGKVEKAAPEQAVAANIQAYKDRLTGAGTPQTAPLPSASSMMFTPMGGMTPAMSSMNLPAQRDSYFPQANPPMAAPLGMPNMNGMGMTPMGYPAGNMMQQPMMPMNMGMMGMPMNAMQGMNFPYQQMGGMRQSSMISLPMQMQQQAMMMEPPMDPRQRNMIDQWRNGVMH